MARRRHSSIPVKHTSTGQAFALQSSVKGLRVEFEAYKKKAGRILDLYEETIMDLHDATQHLRQFVQHKGGCAFIDGGEGSTCSCGAAEADLEVAAALITACAAVGKGGS